MSDGAPPKGASVVIVGAGVTGLSAAWWLARSGVDVLVIEKGVVGWEASGNLAYGGGPHEWLPAGGIGSEALKPSSPIARNIAKRLAELLRKAAHARVIRTWAGIVENTPDGRPVIDRLPTADNATAATMSSVGFDLSPAGGRAIAEIVTEGRCSFADLSTFRLSRFGNLAPG